MRTLYIMRHAKSRWNEPDAADHERGLKKRGKRDATMMGHALAERAAPPYLIVSSTARRAKATARRVARAWGYEGEVRLEDTLYERGPLQCIEMLRELPDSAQSVLLIGHNPTLENLVWAMGGPRLSLSTCATICMAVDIESWSDLALTSESQVRFVLKPKDLRTRDDTTA